MAICFWVLVTQTSSVNPCVKQHWMSVRFTFIKREECLSVASLQIWCEQNTWSVESLQSACICNHMFEQCLMLLQTMRKLKSYFEKWWDVNSALAEKKKNMIAAVSPRRSKLSHIGKICKLNLYPTWSPSGAWQLNFKKEVHVFHAHFRISKSTVHIMQTTYNLQQLQPFFFALLHF